MQLIRRYGLYSLNAVLGQPVPSTCTHIAMLAFHLGAMGISGGGMHTLFSSCLDTRIRACVISGRKAYDFLNRVLGAPSVAEKTEPHVEIDVDRG